jgi:type IV pilus assembly protein PilB
VQNTDLEANRPELDAHSLEALLVREGAATPVQIERARRIAERMKRKVRPGEVLVEMGQVSRTEYERIARLHLSQLGLVQILDEYGAFDAAGRAAYEAARDKAPHATERSLLVENGLVTEEQFLQAVSIRYDIPYVEPEVGIADPSLLARTSFPYLVRHKVLPLHIGDGTLTAILADPLDAQLLSELERIFHVPVKPCCATEAKIVEALQSMVLRDGKPKSEGASLQYREIHESQGHDATGEGAVAILDHLLLRAIQLRASDLHIEPLEKKLRVRVRVDGVMQGLTDLPADFAPQVISRVKVLANCDIAERRLHQDGRICVRVEGREVDIRVSTYASMYGETIVMRLLDRSRGLVPLEELGFEPRVLAQVRELVLRSASGLVLVTGPTGCGKTTTLYSFVDFINDPTVKTISCEDPVEFVLEGVTQCSVNQKTGPTFADSLKAIVRQDPDNIVVGEIRDGVTAALAVEAALTGHKVFSTFHTEDSVGAVVRLVDMGVEPFLVSSTLACIVAQRLVRRSCERCSVPGEASREDLRFLSLDRAALTGTTLMRSHGCPACGGTGFKGRVGIHEVLMPDDDFRDAILRRAPSKELRLLARKLQGFLSLQESGVLKAFQGMTTLTEIVGNAPRDPAPRPPAALREAAGEGRQR